MSDSRPATVADNRGRQPASRETQTAAREFMDRLMAKTYGEIEFHQAVAEVVESVMPMVQATPAYREAKILQRLVGPERVVMFRVPWVEDQGGGQINRGFR